MAAALRNAVPPIAGLSWQKDCWQKYGRIESVLAFHFPARHVPAKLPARMFGYHSAWMILPV
jgi:hypothetical protein